MTDAPCRSAAALLSAALLLAVPLLASPAGAAEVWEGTYDCAQGETGLTLSLDPAADGTASALFHFYEAPGNPGVPEGCFTMSGTLDRATGAFDFQAGRWLLQPWFYVGVDLHGALRDGGTALHGTVARAGCRTFVLRRVARPARATAACYPALVSSLEGAARPADWSARRE